MSVYVLRPLLMYFGKRKSNTKTREICYFHIDNCDEKKVPAISCSFRFALHLVPMPLMPRDDVMGDGIR